MFLNKMAVFLLPFSAAQIVNFEWDCTNSLGTCNNACYAVNNGLAPATLTYDPDRDNADDRRDASGCGRYPCTQLASTRDIWGIGGGFGDSCDEFPFASTLEGGTDSILRCVANSENNSQGGQLSRSLYPALRAAGTSTFGLVVRNWIGAPYCENADDTDNDGGEFTYRNNQYINARDEGSGDFVAAPRLREKKTRPRVFETESGEILLLITPGTGDTMVGNLVHREDGNSSRVHRELHNFWR